MDIKEQMLYGMLLVFAPIVIDLVVGTLRGSRRYRLNDLITNQTLSLLTVLGSVVITGFTLKIYSEVHETYALFAHPPGTLTAWLLGFVAYDFLYYWAHRAHHRIAWLWGIHVVHHSGEDMNFGLAVRQSAFGGATTWFFFLPMALVGIPVEVYVGVAGLQLLYQYFIHNTYVPPLGWLEKVLVTPSQHRVHHSRNRLYVDKNYGNILVLWDILFGSYQPEVATHPPVYGLRQSVRTWNPLTLHVHQAVEMLQKAAACRSLRDKLLCLVKGPDWEPPSLAPERFPGHADEGPSATFRKYDPRIAFSSAAYCVVQFLALTGMVVLLLLNLDAMSTATTAVAFGLILLSAGTLGGLLDGKPRYWRLELGRLATVVLLGAVVMVEGGLFPARMLLPLVLVSAASAIYLLWFRTGFLVEAYEHDGNDERLAARGQASATRT